MKNTDPEFMDLLNELSEMKVLASTAFDDPSIGWRGWRGPDQGGKNICNIESIDLLDNGPNSEAWVVRWNYSDPAFNQCVVIVGRDPIAGCPQEGVLCVGDERQAIYGFNEDLGTEGKTLHQIGQEAIKKQEEINRDIRDLF